MLWVERSSPQIVLSEIMFNPIGNERYDEFIEIYNTSETDTIDLHDWLLSDGEGFNRIRAHEDGSRLPPLSFAIIFVPSYYQQSRYYDAFIPPGALRLTIDKSMFGSYGLNNTRSETVSLFKPDTTMLSSYAYTVPNNDGISEEKIILTAGDQPSNWRHGLVLNGTPGRRNSVSPLDYDLALGGQNCRIVPRSNNASDSLDGIFTIYNYGMRSVKRFQVSILWDANQDEELQLEETLVILQLSEMIAVQDSFVCKCILPPLPAGQHRMWIVLDYPEDENPTNNLIELSVKVAIPPPRLLLSEIMANPKVGFRWWIELFHADSMAIDLEGYRLRSPKLGKDVLLTDQPLFLLPSEYLLVSPASTFDDGYWQPPCRIITTGEQWSTLLTPLYLLDGEERIVDSLIWRGETPVGISLERLGVLESWELCRHPLGATPGARNSIIAPFADAAIRKASISPYPVTYGSPLIFSIKIENFGNLPVLLKELECFRINAQALSDTMLVRRLDVARQVAPRDSTILSYEAPPCEAGVYQFHFRLKAEDDAYPMNNTDMIKVQVPYQKNALIINELFYHTEEKQQEWIELYNPWNVTFNLQGCTIKDAHKGVRITESRSVLPDQYLVLSNQFLTVAEDPTFRPLVIPSLPEWNNSGDQVILLSPEGICIDSVAYSASWGGGRLVSLERIRWEDDSNDPANWHSCKDPIGSTPGRINSCSPKQIDAAVVTGSLTVWPSLPQEGETIAVSCLVENVGRNDLAKVHLTFYFFDDQDQETILARTEIEGIEPRQQRSVTIYWQHTVAGTITLCCSLQTSGDQNENNNRDCRRLMIGYRQSPIVINEIMYSPAEGQPEWIECYNRSDFSVNVEKWLISDADTLKKRTMVTQTLLVKPHSYWVIAADMLNPENGGGSSIYTVLKDWPALNNTGDAVVLYDCNGRVVDRVDFTKEWGGAIGRSLERLNPHQPSAERTNWATCAAANGHTAGAQNSVYFDVLPASTTLEVSPVPFSPDGDGFEDYLAISYHLPAQTARVNIRIFDRNGNLVRFLCNYEHSGSQATKFWDGLDGEGRRCRMGLYIVHLQAFDEYHGKIMEAKKVCVLALRL